MRLNLARTLRRSAANGPGERFVVWVQGCPLACGGCWNPDTWSFQRRLVCAVGELTAEILTVDGIEGVTFTGGEPFMQARALAEVGRAVRRAGLSVFVFTGYELEELGSEPARDLLSVTDVLVTGRYVEAARTTELPWRGSANQRVHFLTQRYSPTDMEQAPEAEIRISPDGTIALTGFPAAELVAVAGRRASVSPSSSSLPPGQGKISASSSPGPASSTECGSQISVEEWIFGDARE